MLNNAATTLRLLYDMQMATVYEESIVETMGSSVGYLLAPNISVAYLEKMLMLYLSLPNCSLMSFVFAPYYSILINHIITQWQFWYMLE